MNPDLEPTLTQPQLPPASPRASRRPQLRTLFWPGFAAGFLLLSLLSCGGLVLATGLNRIDLQTIQGNSAGWTPPAVPPTATPAAAVEPAAPVAGTFALNEVARNVTNSRVNIRQTPGHLSKSTGDILAQLEPGATVEIIGGPTAADNLTWWLIRYQTPDGRPIEGWVAEATQSGVQILGR